MSVGGTTGRVLPNHSRDTRRGVGEVQKGRVKVVRRRYGEKASAACGQHEVAFKGYEDVPTDYAASRQSLACLSDKAQVVGGKVVLRESFTVPKQPADGTGRPASFQAITRTEVTKKSLLHAIRSTCCGRMESHACCS
jgi:hypothetical protein